MKIVMERLTKQELAERLKVDPRTINRYVKRGLLQPERLPGGQVRFKADAVEQMIRESTRRARVFFGGQSANA